MVLVVGVDGCPGGWVAITWDTEAGTLTPAIHITFAELVEATADVEAVGVDIPIGLHEGRPRGADRAARALLGPRRGSVFPAPDRRLIGGGTHAGLSARSRELTGTGISRQAHAIYPKIAEVDAVMTPALQRRIIEVHPEVSFTALAGHPMAHAKKRPEGFDERRAALEAELGFPLWDRAAARAVARPALSPGPPGPTTSSTPSSRPGPPAASSRVAPSRSRPGPRRTGAGSGPRSSCSDRLRRWTGEGRR